MNDYSSDIQYQPLIKEDDHTISESEAKIPLPPPDGVLVYKRRWYVLAVFCLLGMLQALIWNTWGPIMDSTQAVFQWSEGKIAMFSNVGNSIFCLTVFLSSWVMDVLGLRVAGLAATLMIFVGTALRCITSHPVVLYWLSMLANFLAGIGGAVTFAGPALFSSIWFPAHQRATTTAIITLANYGGMSVAFLLGPLMVSSPVNSTTHNHSHWNSSHMDSIHTQDDIDKIRHEIMRLLYVECGIAGITFLLFLIYFPAKPPTPPSISASEKRLDFRKGLWELTTKRQFWLVALAYALPTGTFGVWGTVLDANFGPVGVHQNDAGWIGFYSTTAGAVAGLIVSRFSDVFARHMKTSLLIMYTLSAASLTWVTILCERYVPFSMAQLYASVILAGIFTNGSIPLFYELSCEVCYPVAEGIIGGYLTFMNNLFGTTFLFLLLIKSIGTIWMTWVLLGTTLLAIPVLGLLKESYSRLKLDTEDQNNSQDIGGVGSVQQRAPE